MQETEEIRVRSLGREDAPGAGNDNPLQYPCLAKSHGQRSLVDYSPWDHKKLDMIKWLNTPIILKFALYLKPELRLHGAP